MDQISSDPQLEQAVGGLLQSQPEVLQLFDSIAVPQLLASSEQGQAVLALCLSLTAGIKGVVSMRFAHLSAPAALDLHVEFHEFNAIRFVRALAERCAAAARQ